MAGGKTSKDGTAPLQNDSMEGHGDDSPLPTLSKGTFMDSGVTYVDLPSGNQAISANRKSGSASGVGGQ